MPEARFVRTAKLSSVAEYAYAAVLPAHTQIVFCAGACPIDLTGAVVEVGDVAAQTRRALANLQTALEEAGASYSTVVRTTIYVASSRQSDLVAAWDVTHATFAENEPPSTLLGVAALGYANQLVEIDAIALVE
ncbi:RidA family protein [Modestobacter sp. VKM Ac-2977]|uniref:RidA family protein n=1 Tax=Modestobacter sp. VKM Ac-2977 TaxID=3004131 RepID=UPI0022AACB60|nr:RidA family protein [Modestobacter sp. VKM Ac-2977]MCZ2819221.1 RidA family protein [Modestobacter sp. VKM Ac-2977]